MNKLAEVGPVAPGQHEVWAFLYTNQGDEGMTTAEVAEALGITPMAAYLRLGGIMWNGFATRDGERPNRYTATLN
jgi:hypothetical protein